MSQPPQNGWGQPSPEDPYGQSSSASGYGQQGYGQEQPNYGQQNYGQDQPGSGQPSPNSGYGQDSSFAPSFGNGGAQAYAPQGAVPKKSNKLPLIICAGCAVLALLLIVVGAGIFLFAQGGGEPTGGETTQVETAPVAPTTEETTAEETTSAEATSEAPAGDGQGTKDNPYPSGQMFTLEDGEGGTYDVTIGAIDWAATDKVMEANQFNAEPAEGETYILVPVDLTYHGSGETEPFLAVTVEYVTNGGNTFSDAGTVTPNTAFDVGTLHDGGSGSWQIGIIVPEDQAQDGVLKVAVPFNFDGEPVWVVAA